MVLAGVVVFETRRICLAHLLDVGASELQRCNRADGVRRRSRRQLVLDAIVGPGFLRRVVVGFAGALHQTRSGAAVCGLERSNARREDIAEDIGKAEHGHGRPKG